MEPGDVIIILQQKEHELFTRKDSDLIMQRSISLTEALCGFHFVIKHLDGRDLVIRNQPGEIISPGENDLSFLELFYFSGTTVLKGEW